METKKCRECGRELPITEFKYTRWGHYTEVCKECANEKRAETHYKKKMGNMRRTPYSDPDFDGKQPVEVIQMMKRAKMWLEAQGYTITLVRHEQRLLFRGRGFQTIKMMIQCE